MRNHRRQMLAVLELGSATVAAAQETAKGDMAMEKGSTMVGGQAMFRSKDIVTTCASRTV